MRHMVGEVHIEKLRPMGESQGSEQGVVGGGARRRGVEHQGRIGDAKVDVHAIDFSRHLPLGGDRLPNFREQDASREGDPAVESAGGGRQATGSCAAPHFSKGAASPVSSLTLEISMARFLLRRLPEPSMGPSPRLVRPAVSALAFSAARESSLASSGRDQPSSAVGVRTAAGAGPGTGCPAAPSLGSSLVEKTTAIGPLQRAVWLRVRSGGSSWWSVQMPLEVPLIMPAPGSWADEGWHHFQARIAVRTRLAKGVGASEWWRVLRARLGRLPWIGCAACRPGCAPPLSGRPHRSTSRSAKCRGLPHPASSHRTGPQRAGSPSTRGRGARLLSASCCCQWPRRRRPWPRRCCSDCPLTHPRPESPRPQGPAP